MVPMMQNRRYGWMTAFGTLMLLALAVGAARAAADATTGTQVTASTLATTNTQATTSTQTTTATQAAMMAKVEVKSSIENLKTSFNGESNANARYLAFAKKADEEGYKGVASLFRATAKAEEIHARNQAEAIKKLTGQDPKAELKVIEVKTTKENLAASLAGENYERLAMYPAFIKKAREEQNKDALRAFNGARATEEFHAKYYAEALKNVDDWKAAPRDFFVCPVCGETVSQADLTFAKCPICYTPKEKFLKVV